VVQAPYAIFTVRWYDHHTTNSYRARERSFAGGRVRGVRPRARATRNIAMEETMAWLR